MVRCLSFVVNCSLSVVRCSLFVVCCLSFARYLRLLIFVLCGLFYSLICFYWLVFVVCCCSLSVVCWLMYCCLLIVDC